MTDVSIGTCSSCTFYTQMEVSATSLVTIPAIPHKERGWSRDSGGKSSGSTRPRYLNIQVRVFITPRASSLVSLSFGKYTSTHTDSTSASPSIDHQASEAWRLQLQPQGGHSSHCHSWFLLGQTPWLSDLDAINLHIDVLSNVYVSSQTPLSVRRIKAVIRLFTTRPRALHRFTTLQTNSCLPTMRAD